MRRVLGVMFATGLLLTGCASSVPPLASGHTSATEKRVSLDSAVAAFLDQHSGLRERARFRHASEWIVVVDGAVLSEGPQYGFEYTALRAQQHAAGWDIVDSEDGGSQGCFSNYMRSGSAQTGYEYAIARDPRWHIEGKSNGGWREVTTTNGVAFADLTAGEAGLPTELRPVDQSGQVPHC